jgi:hypothetical protein
LAPVTTASLDASEEAMLAKSIVVDVEFSFELNNARIKFGMFSPNFWVTFLNDLIVFPHNAFPGYPWSDHH